MIGLPRAPRPDDAAHRGYGNIYTPHAGSMIIQVQRESGLQSRTIVLSPRQVRLLGFFTSRAGRIVGIAIALTLTVIAVEAARVPLLTYRLSHMEHNASRLDTLERSLAELQKRYDQVQRMLGASTKPTDAFPVATDSALHRPVTTAHASRAARTAGPVTADSAAPTPDSTVAPSKAADPMD
jgi:hypothetical protein